MDQEGKGILVEQIVQTESKRHNRKLHMGILWVFQFVYLVLASLGIAEGFLGAFQIPASKPILIIGILLLCLIYTFIFSMKRKIRYLLPGFLMIVAIAAVFFFRGLIAEGMGCIFNQIVKQINVYYDLNVPFAATGVLSDTAQMPSIFLILIVLIGILAAGIVYYLDARITALIMTIPLAFALAVGLFPDAAAAIMLFISLVGVFFLQYTKNREAMYQQTVTVEMGDTLLSRLRWQTAAIAAAFMLVLIPLSYFAAGPAINRVYESQSALREDIRNGELLENMREFWKKLVRGEWDWLPFDIIRSSGVHGGKLSNVKEVRDYDELHLYLAISDDLNAPLYIRGYVGSNYTGKGWKDQTKEQQAASVQTGVSAGMLGRNYYELLEQLQQQGGSNIYGRLRYVITNNEANSKYSYIAYGTDIGDFEGGTSYDVYTQEKTDETILNLYYLNTQRLSNLELVEQTGTVRGGDEAYAAFARAVYLDLPTEGLERFYQEYGGYQFNSVTDCVKFVRENLMNHAEYTKTPGSTPKGKDYVEYFLYENKQGVCTHFASAAVLMFRLFGIPARYVEGYLTNSLSAEDGPNKIMDTSAHAWPEIYVDGVGWLPVEVTPGFLNEADMVDDRSNSNIQSGDDIDDMRNPEEETEEQPVDNLTQEEETNPIPTEPTQPSTTAQEATKPTEPTEPTKPSQQQPTTPSGEQKEETSNKLGKLIVRIILSIVLVVFLIAFVLFVIHFQYQKRKEVLKKRLYGNTPREGILNTLGMIECISAEEGLMLDEYTDWKQAQKKYPFLNEETLRWYQRLSLEAVFSLHEFEPEVRDDAVGFYQEITEVIEKESNPWKRFVYRYIKCYF